jgi:tetratricopeptide (TPR) repeat protein
MLNSRQFEEVYDQAMVNRLQKNHFEAINACTDLVESGQLDARQLVLTLELRGFCSMKLRRLRAANEDLERACSIAETGGTKLTLEHAHAITTLVRLRLRQGRIHAAEQLMGNIEGVLKRLNDPESHRLRASVVSLYGVIRFRQGRTVKSLACFEKAEGLLERYPDRLRQLRNTSRMAFALAWFGMRVDAWRYAKRLIQLGQDIVEGGHADSIRLGRFIKVLCWLPIPPKWLLRPFREEAGL